EEGSLISLAVAVGEGAEDGLEGDTTGEDGDSDSGGDTAGGTDDEHGGGTETREAENLYGIATINATSILAPDAPGVSYSTSNLVDENPETCWAEGVPGYGIGEMIVYTFPHEIEVTKIYCIPGLLKVGDRGQDRWLQNGRLKTVKISFDDGTQTTFTFTDEKKWQEITLDRPHKTLNVTFTIVDVYPGRSGPNWTAAEDTSVSELHVWGYY
ncbi:MAG: hypothetical protein HPY75_14290, partial [Actinobacteria bacterium]|nr:hypothetical protein [Actinomycetota bacterium]